jgi:sialate O-acetylesterase
MILSLPPRWSATLVLAWSSLLAPSFGLAEVQLPNIFTDHMVLQRDQANKVWGKADPGEPVTVSIASHQVSAVADPQGLWSVMLPKLPVGGPHEMLVRGKNQIAIQDVLVGEVWICSGQSNMQWTVDRANDPDLEKLASNFPRIRMINFPQVGSQASIWSHDDRKWLVSNADNVGSFSAVGYFFARQLHQTLDVPIGMINNAWGGSSCEAWIDRSVLQKAGGYETMLASWTSNEATLRELENKADKSEEDQKKIVALKKNLSGNHNPGNIYHGVLASHIGYGIRGAIWYQGESNATRAYQYRQLFPLMISSWRNDWKQGDFPFYWVQLADFKAEVAEPAESEWAELREAQTMTMQALPKTGQAVIIDLGEGKDIHPKNKVDVARRLARWALANEYGISIPHRSPQYRAMEVVDGKVKLTFDHVDGGWRPFDVAAPQGFAVAGADHRFVWADAQVQKDNSIVVSAPEVKQPVAVRYGWADNPGCNLFSAAGLPLTPFRTDDWPGITANAQ